MMDIKIYQINLSRDDDRVAFLGLSQLDKFQESSKVNSEIYDKVFEGAVEADTLEGVYQDFTMLRQACELIQKWKPVWPDIVLNVNFSRNTLMEPDFLERIDQILSETGVNPVQLIFEITESSQNIQLESLCSLLDEVNQRGISLAIDDLGTEAACLEMLYLPQISVAKIDKSLIDKAEHNEREQLVIRHLINLCHDLNMRCVAEGIETDSQIELLKKLGCDKLQGYKIGKPMLPEDFLRQFGNNR